MKTNFIEQLIRESNYRVSKYNEENGKKEHFTINVDIKENGGFIMVVGQSVTREQTPVYERQLAAFNTAQEGGSNAKRRALVAVKEVYNWIKENKQKINDPAYI